eukprot:TRINITY_DN3414_c0_g1_i10.p1 TRINITY_DN3414_c0_g1~~TRINITY_DN3414_c0_g1_i10.p1  ORF type:complete len:1436 (+),score=244.45 TRINITY_DN3414_c0_g1_i10:118-4425(+)
MLFIKMIILMIGIFQSKVGSDGWVLESQYPPESNYPRIAVVGDDAYYFSDLSPTFGALKEEFMDRYWKLDTRTLEWSNGLVEGDLPKKREEYCIATMENQFYMFGGYAYPPGRLNDLYRFDTESKRWNKISPESRWPISRYGHSCFSWSGYYYVYGGYSYPSQTDMWQYDPGLNVWSEIRSNNSAPQSSLCLGQIYGDVFYLFEAKRVSSYYSTIVLWSYDLVGNSWKKEADYPGSEFLDRVNLALWKNKIISFGGYDSWYDDTNTLKVISLDTKAMIMDKDYYRVETDVPFPISKLSARSNSFTFATKEKVIVFGGYVFNGLNDVWVLDPVSFEWTDSSLSRYPIPRYDARTVAVSDDQFAMFGGWIYLHYDEQLINDLWIYDANKKKWIRLWQESPCRETEVSCMPIVDSPAVGAFDGKVYIVGGQTPNGDGIQPIARVFHIGERSWKILATGQDFLDTAGSVYQAQYASLGSLLYVWSGRNSEKPGVGNSISILDMQMLNSSVVSSKAGWPVGRYGGSGFIWESRFCFHGGQIPSQDDYAVNVWCYANSIWIKFRDKSANRLTGFGGSVQVHGLPMSIGGEAYDDSGSYMNIFYNDKWSQFLSYNLWPLCQQGLSSVKLGSKIFVFGGENDDSYDSTSMVYSLNFGNPLVLPTFTITAEYGVVTEKSNGCFYFPNIHCSWEIIGSNWILISKVSLGDKANLLIEKPRSCERDLRMNNIKLGQLNVASEHEGVLLFAPSNRLRLNFVVNSDSLLGGGFEISHLGCIDGFVRNGTACVCPKERFVSFRGECMRCPPNTFQSANDTNICVPESSLQVSEDDENITISKGQLNTLDPGEVRIVTTGIPATVFAAAATINGTVYLVGGKISDGNDLKQDYQAMSQMYVLKSSVLTEWQMMLVGGDIPKPRARHCFVSLDTYAVLFGGDNSKDDNYVYHFHPETKQWTRKQKPPFVRTGMICARNGASIIAYGGMNVEGIAQQDLWSYKPESDSWTLLSQKETNPAIANAAGAMIDEKFVIFSGTNGTSDHNAVHLFHLAKEFHVERVELQLSECVLCDEDVGSCSFGRQDSAMGVFGDELHIYGGFSKGYVLHDVLIFSLRTKQIIMRTNYAWEITSLPVEYPPPKRGSAYAYDGEYLVIVGGTSGPGYAAADTWTWSMEMETWADASISRKPIQRAGSAILKLDETRFIIFGGRTMISEEVLLNDLWEFSIDSKEWKRLFRETETSDAPPPRTDAAISYANNTIYIMGGRTYMSVTDTKVWLFSLETKSWSSKALPDVGRNFRPLNRVGASSVQLASQLLIFGGQLSGVLRGQERYAPILELSENIVEALRTTPGTTPGNRRYASASAIDDRRIFMHGGVSFDGQLLDDGWILDTDQEMWIPMSKEVLSAIPTGISQSTSLGYHGNTILIGGYHSSGIASSAFMVQHGMFRILTHH